jgi:hypothetical protein
MIFSHKVCRYEKGLVINMNDNKMRSTKNHKKEDGTFHSKHVKHDPQAESARAVFGLKENNPKNKSSDTSR